VSLLFQVDNIFSNNRRLRKRIDPLSTLAIGAGLLGACAATVQACHHVNQVNQEEYGVELSISLCGS
jgi:hypothetical protein